MHLGKVGLDEFLGNETFRCNLVDEAYIELPCHDQW
jgi:hypothetical protein